jgi:hypothetical protein
LGIGRGDFSTRNTMRARFADLGATVLVGSPEDFGKLITAETEQWSKVVRFANIKLE